MYSMIMLLVSVFLLSSCSKVPKYAKLIPSDADMMVRFDVKQAFEKSEVSGDKKSMDQLKKLLKESNLSSSAQKKIQSILSDPASLGLDLRDPVVLYANDIVERKPEVALVGSVYDKDDFKSFLDVMAKEGGMDKVREKDGVCFMVERDFGIFFDSDCFYIVGNSEGLSEKEFAKESCAKLSEDSDDSMAGTDKMDKFCSYDGIVQMLISGELVESAARKEHVDLDVDLDFNKIDFVFDWACEPGETSLTFEYLTDDSDWKKQLESSSDVIGEIKGELCELVPAESAAFFMNGNGSKVWELIEESGVLDKGFGSEETKMFRSCIEAVNGDVAMYFSDIDLEQNMPTAACYIQTENKGILDILKKNTDAERDGSDIYKAPLSRSYDWETDEFTVTSYWKFGTKNGVTGMAVNPDNKIFNKTSKSFDKGAVNGKSVYGFVSAKFVLAMLNKTKDGNPYYEPIYNLVKLFDKAECYTEGTTKAVFKLVLKDKDANFIKSMIDYAKNNATKIMEAGSSSYYDYDYDDDYVAVDSAYVDDDYDYDDYAYAEEDSAYYY